MSTVSHPQVDIRTIIERGSGEVPIASIQVVEGFNARTIDTDAQEFKDLVESLKAMGILVPLIVAGEDLQLVAGHRRLLAAQAAGMDTVPVIVRDAADAHRDAAVENMARADLWPLEEANAIKAMLDNGYTADGAAQMLGVSRRLITERMVLFGLPDKARSFFGPAAEAGHMPLAFLKVLLPIAKLSPDLCDVVAAYTYEKREFNQRPAWLVGRAAKADGVFAESMDRLDESRLLNGDGPKALVELYGKLKKARPTYGYSPPYVFEEQDIDQARAAGVLLEFPAESGYGASHVCVDKKLYESLRRESIKRQATAELEQLTAAKPAKTSTKKMDPATGEPVPPTPQEIAAAKLREAEKAWPSAARGANGELGAALLNNLASVPVTMDVARFFVYGLLGVGANFNDAGKYMNMGSAADQTAVRLARAGMRLCLDQLVTVEEVTLKSGKPGKAKISYATDKQCEEWLWKFLDGAKTPEELFGRALACYAAASTAVQDAVPNSQREYGSQTPGSRKDVSAKVLAALVKPHVPASLKALRAQMAKARKAAS